MRAVGIRCLVLLLAVVAACEPQVVDAVDSAGAGGSGATGATGAVGATGGSGVGGDSGSGGTDTAGTGGSDTAGSGNAAGLNGLAGGCNLDSDGDGYSNCEDDCLVFRWKKTPGACGCEYPDYDEQDNLGTVAGCIPIREALVHRYSFEGTNSTVRDLVSGADGNLAGGVLPMNGSVTLAGGRNGNTGAGEWVNLPNGILSELTSVTLEAWLTWAGPSGGDWQRVFDFGDEDTMMEGDRSAGRTYLFMTPQLPDSAVEGPFVRVAFQGPDVQQEVRLTGTRGLPAGMPVHVAFTFDNAEKRLALYIDGELDTDRLVDPDRDPPMSLSVINDINCWLGRSQYALDADFGGSFDEFRIYSVALTPLQVRTSHQAGPNAPYLLD